MGLQEDAIDLFEVDGLGAVSHCFEQVCDAEVASAAQHAFRRADEQAERIVGEGAVREGDPVELSADEGCGVVWGRVSGAGRSR